MSVKVYFPRRVHGKQNWILIFIDHPLLEIFYEDLSHDYSEEMHRVFNFLNVELRQVTPQTHKQSQR